MEPDREQSDGRFPPIVDQDIWEAALGELREREKAATRELDAIAAARWRLPMVELPDYPLDGPDGPVRVVDVFDGKRQLILYHHMWFPGEEWQCGGCTGFTSQFTRLEFLDAYDARFVIVTQGPIDEALAYKARVGNRMDWYSTANSPFGSDMGAPPNGGFQLNVFLRVADTAYRTYNTQGHGVEQVSHTFPLIDGVSAFSNHSSRVLNAATISGAFPRSAWQTSRSIYLSAPLSLNWVLGLFL
ncbi:MAG: DUF899 domain-containing protein [Actinobacteria bacterium]|nr:DUF899 domain-containing protein [Actinomycetota bacterium]MBW3651013.1 DUF899 domain-containing protein [Actinomycetota bacterium]